MAGEIWPLREGDESDSLFSSSSISEARCRSWDRGHTQLHPANLLPCLRPIVAGSSIARAGDNLNSFASLGCLGWWKLTEISGLSQKCPIMQMN